ncbi:MAG: cellulose synthase subunit BcsC-related outer membrane protein [Acidobacteriaceae bacterium]
MSAVVPLSMPLFLAPMAGYAQTSDATRTLLDKAHSLEARGRIDLASQAWQQVLLSDPNNTEALGGLARAAKLSGNEALTNQYLNRLRAINPNDPNIDRVQSMVSQPNQVAELQKAGQLASSGMYDQAMNIYRQVFGSTPPPGDWALAYYQTEAATQDGRDHAIAGLRSLIAQYPKDSRYQITLGRILTYNPKTRAEGRAYLERHPQDPSAMEALRQSLMWDAGNPAMAPTIRAYLARHNDPELAARMRDTLARQALAAKSGGLTPEEEQAQAATRAQNAQEAAAYAALNGKRLTEAAERFQTILASQPDNPRALAGMGYVRMNQGNFGGAISYLEQARQDGAKDPGVDKALATSRFWYTMGDASAALNENDVQTAEKQYRAALAMQPDRPEALEGLAGTLLKEQRPAEAVDVYQHYLRVKPNDAAAWRGLFISQYQAGHPAQALQTEKRMPASVRTALWRDPDFLRTLASAYSAVGRDADAQRVLKSALDLPFPENGRGLKAETQVQYAGLLLQANRVDQAAGLYRQALASDPSNVSAWQGLVRTEHTMKQDAQAVKTLESMPQATYDMALRDPGFLSTIASIYQSQNQLEVAQGFLERAVTQQTMAGQKPPIPLELQLASVYLARNNPQQAYPIYRQVLMDSPDRPDAWNGLLSSLHETGHDREAVAQVQQIPPNVRSQLEDNVAYLQTMGGVYNSLGDSRQAMVFLNRVKQHYEAQRVAAPADIDIQNAWLLFNSGDDTGLYNALMKLGGRGDLTAEQRRTVQTIWASWAVRRANQAAAAGRNKRALLILNAASQAFPDNPGVSKALAAGYLRAGLPKQAVMIFKTQDMTSATASDYKAAVGAALASGDNKIAETWLRYGLDLYPQDPQILSMAAKFEEARGDSSRAADYYKASLAAMPPPDPGADLAAELASLPDTGTVATLPSKKQQQPQDLASMLAPGSEITGAPTGPPPAPYLPSYNNAYGQAPVQLSNGASASASSSAYTPNPYAAPAGNGSYGSGYNNGSGYGTPLPAPVAKPAPRGNEQLKDYVPQASTEAQPMPVPQGASGYIPAQTNASVTYPQTNSVQMDTAAYQTQQGSATSEDAAYQADQREQIRRSIEQAEQSQQYGPPESAPVPDVRAGSSNPAPFYVDRQRNKVSSLPHLRTQEPESAMTPYSHQEQTDIFPSVRYVPNAPATETTSHPDIAAAEAESVRANQSRPLHGHSMEGQSHPPQDAYTNTYQNTSYVDSPGMVPQPDVTAGNAVQAPQQQTYDQQYQQPVDGRTPRRRAAPLPGSTTTAAPQQPLGYPPPPNSGYQSYPPAPTAQSYPLGTAPSDSDLMQRNLPPLRGPYNPNAAREAVQLSPRAQTEHDLATLEASYSGWLGGTGIARYRSGTPGFDRLIDLEAPFEASVVLGKAARLTVIPRAVFLNSGIADGTSTNRLGTLPIGATPSEQLASGVGGELQLTTANFGAAVGYTPYEFLISNITGRFRWKPFGGPFTLHGERQPVTDTQLSYAGLRDPGSATNVYGGNIWGGVISTGGGVRLDVGDERSGFYVGVEGAQLTGQHVQDNIKFDGEMGAYWRVYTLPGYGNLQVGANFFGEHYQYNELGYTYGQGGYFSPEAYFLAAVPVTWNGHYKTDWHYTINGTVGVQAFQQDKAPYFPLDVPLQTAYGNPFTPVSTNAGLNYNLNSQAAYRVADHWYIGGFLTGNNTNNYNTVSGGFFVRYLFRSQQPTEDYPTGLFPYEGFRPLRVP